MGVDGWGQQPRVLGLAVGGGGHCWGKMIACDVSQVVILGQGTAGSLPAGEGRLRLGKGAGLN